MMISYFRSWRKMWFAMTVVAVGGPLVQFPGSAWAQKPAPNSVTVLTVHAERNLGRSWEVERAESAENFDSIELTVTVRNTSGHSVPSAYFFGRYYDALGRLCFTSLFSLVDNLEGQTVPASAGEIRTLRSVSFLVPATTPSVLKVSVSHRAEVPGKSSLPPGLAAPATPVMIASRSVSADDNWRGLCLGGHSQFPADPVVDVGLASGVVGPQGTIRNFEVVGALASRPYVSWLQHLAQYLNFIPASRNGRPVASETLVLVRALLREWRQGERPFAASSNPWVERFVSGLAGPVPPVQIVVLYPPHKGLPLTTPDSETGPCFAYSGVGTAWSAGFPYLIPPASRRAP
jgi:hypothetical protein